MRWVTELAMGGRGIHAIIEAVQQITINTITVESEIPYIEGVVDTRIIAPLNWAQKNELIAAKYSIRMERLLNDQPTSCIVTPLLLNDELYGYVTCWQTEQKFRELDFVVLDRVIPLLALEFLKVKTKADVEQNFKDDFLSDILLGQFKEKTEVITKAKMFGWDLTRDYQVFAIVFEHVSIGEKQGNEVVWFQEWKKRLLRRVNNIFRYNGYKVIVGIRKDHIVVLFPREDVKALPCFPQRNDPYKEQLMQIAESVRKQLAQEFEDFNFTIGIGRCSKGLEGIPKG